MLETSLKLFTIGLLGIMSPGPDFILISRNAIRYPKFQALLTSLGINLGLTVHITLNLLGVGFIIKSDPIFSIIFKYLGAGYLIKIGVDTFFSKSRDVIVTESLAPPSISNWQAFREGLFCNLLNLKAMLFFFGIFTQVIDQKSSWFEQGVYAGIFIVQALLYWPLLVLVLQNKTIGKTLKKYQKSINIVFGILLIAFGLQMALFD